MSHLVLSISHLVLSISHLILSLSHLVQRLLSDFHFCTQLISIIYWLVFSLITCFKYNAKNIEKYTEMQTRTKHVQTNIHRSMEIQNKTRTQIDIHTFLHRSAHRQQFTLEAWHRQPVWQTGRHTHRYQHRHTCRQIYTQAYSRPCRQAPRHTHKRTHRKTEVKKAC